MENISIKCVLILYIIFYLTSCSAKTNTVNNEKDMNNIDGIDIYYKKGRNVYKTEEEYYNSFYDFNYFGYRNVMLYRCLQKNDFTYFNYEILGINNNEPLKEDHLYGNQINNDYMKLIREVIHIKNNLSFGNKEIDNIFISIYNYYNPNYPKQLLPIEKNILLQINSFLYPKEEEIDIEKLNDHILGTWQKDDYDIGDYYLDTLKFSNETMTIAVGEQDKSQRFSKLEGKYKIENKNIIMHPNSYDYIEGGEYIITDEKRYIGERIKKVDLFPNGLISYPIISFSKIYNEFENKSYYKLVLFLDKPLTYYKIK
jgi:hypothetical protein